MEYLGKVILHQSERTTADQLPDRLNLVLNSQVQGFGMSAREVVVSAQRKEPILFLSHDVIEMTSGSDFSHKLVPIGTRRDGSDFSYKLVLIGTLRDGSKAGVVINGIKPFFDIKVPDDAEPNTFAMGLNSLMKSKEIRTVKYGLVSSWAFDSYHHREIIYVRMYFPTTRQRKDAITLLHSEEFPYRSRTEIRTAMFETALCDMSCYYRKVCREHRFNLAGWNVIENYVLDTSNKYFKRSAYVSHRDPVRFVFQITISGITSIEDAGIDPTATGYEDLTKDKTLICGWDLETYSRHNNGNPPGVDDVIGSNHRPEAMVFMGCLTFRWNGSTETALRICITDLPAPCP